MLGLNHAVSHFSSFQFLFYNFASLKVVSSLILIKNRQLGYIFINLAYKISTRMLYVCIKYSLFDLVCDVISCCLKLRYGKNQCIW